MEALRTHRGPNYCAIAIACSTLSACWGGGGDSNPYQLERIGTKVEVTPIYQDCGQDSDCTLMEISCDFCCVRDAVGTSLVDQFEHERQRACADFDGPSCSCIPQPMTARCVNDTCVAVPTGENSPPPAPGSDAGS